MKNKILKFIQFFCFIIGGLMIVYGTVGAITKVMVPRGGTGQGEFEAGAFLIGDGTNKIATTSNPTPSLTHSYLLVGDVTNTAVATSSIVVDDNGKMGISTTTPAYDLDVYGNIRADGDVRTTGTFYGDTWSSATNNSMNIQPSGDVDDFFSFKTPAHRPTIKREGGKFIYLESSNVYDVGISARADDTYSGTLNYEKDNHMMTMLGKNSPLGFKANSDYDDYIKIQTTSNTPEITVVSSSALKINAGGTNDLLLNHAGGNVGIGTTEPNRELTVNGEILLEWTDGGDMVTLSPTATGGLLNIRDAAHNAIIGFDGRDGSDRLMINTSDFVVKNDGKVGIGTNNSQNKLDIEGGLAVGATYSGTNTAPSNGAIIEGNVGIGTTSPLSKFSMNSGSNGFRIDSSGIVQQGSWQGTDIGVSYGGTGLSSATAGNVLIGFGGNSLQATSSIFIDSNEKIGIGTTTPAMKFSVQGDALADSWNVYSNIYQGNAISQLNKIKPEKGKKGDWASVDHDTLPDGVVSHVQMDGYVLPTMSIDALAQMNTKAVQELYEINVSQTERIEELEANIVKIYDMLYNNCICEFSKK